MLGITEKSLHRGMLNHLAFLLVIIVMTFAAYARVLHGELLFDDRSIILTNPLLQSPYAFSDLNLWDAFKSGLRPVTAFTFSLNYYLFGKDPFSYHLTNLIIHIINGILVYVFIYITLVQDSVSPTTPAPTYQGGEKWGVRRQWIAFLTALLFSIHPIQTESVSYIYQRAESLSSMFYLVSIIAFIVGSQGLRIKVLCYLIFILGFVLAMGSKEIAVTLPLAALLYGIYFFEKKGLWKRVAVPVTLIFSGLAVAAIRMTSLRENLSAGYSLSEFTLWEFILTQFSVILSYMRLLIFPFGQNIDPVYPISRSLFEIKTIFSITLLLLPLSLAWIFFRRWRTGSFFILWFFVTLSPSSSILPLRDLLAEHRLYLPSIGVFFILSSAMVYLSNLWLGKMKKGVIIPLSLTIFLLLSGLFWTVTYNRNRYWTSELAMWQDVIKKSPRNQRGYNNLARAYNEKGLHDKAIENYLISIKIKQDDPVVHRYLGIAYNDKGLTDKAIEHYRIAISLKPDYAEAHNNLGSCYLLKGEYKNALIEYLETLSIDPNNFETYYNAGLSLKNLGMTDLAREFFVLFVKTGPEDYSDEKRKLSFEYNITGNTALPDLRLLIQSAKNLFGQVK